MNENTAVVLNLQSPNISTVVYAVQNDRLSRHITAQLLDGASPWTPPALASAVIRYLKPDGTAGFYDVDEDGNDAITISGSVATLTIAEQALTVPGDVYMQLNFYTADEERLTTFAWLLRVQKSVIEDAEIVSSDYFNALTEKIAEGIEVAQQLTYPVPIMNGGTGATNAAGARANLGLGSAALENVPMAIGVGGTGATTASAARTNIGAADVSFEPLYLSTLKNGKTLTFSGTCNFLLVLNANNLTRRGMYLVWANTTASPTLKAILEAADITFTTSTATLSMTSSPQDIYATIIPLNADTKGRITVS